MSEWDFLWGLSGQELEDTMSFGRTAADWDYVEDQERIKRKEEWDKLKVLGYNGKISKEEFEKRKSVLFSKRQKLSN